MRKSIIKTKLTLKRETLKVLEANSLQLVAGGGPLPTRDLPCPVRTAQVDCG